MPKSSCISDRPLKSHNDDMLDTMTYVKGLFNFILRAETPITIGIQGGWGSGKTSLINMLQEKLHENVTNKTSAVCVFVNAWEHSLLQAQSGKAEVTLSLLQGILEEMKDAITQTERISPDVKESTMQKDGLFDRTKKAATALAMFGVRTAVKMHLGVDLNPKDSPSETPPVAKMVRELRESLAKTVTDITKHENCPSRFVFFIDDLDRVPPETAVEILDVTKNIFDITGCIFILAIDYEVVVKGLEGKFGKKTEENEREFRQYFDKIIQIPFTMPVGTYDKQMDQMLKHCFTGLGYQFDEAESGDQILSNLRNAAMAATDGIPRSVKRIINTLSLLQLISTNKRAQSEDANLDLNSFEIRFIVVSLHINYPEICRNIMEMPMFTDWDPVKMEDRWQLGKVDFERLTLVFGEPFNEPWEHVVYCLCQKNHWLKTRAIAVSDLMNCLRTALQRNRNPAQKDDSLSDEEVGILENILADIRIVSVDEVPPPSLDNTKVKSDHISLFCRQLHQSLDGKIEGIAPFIEEKYHAKGKRARHSRTYSIAIENSLINEIRFKWDHENEEFEIACHTIGPKGNKVQFKRDLANICEQEDIITKDYYCSYIFEEFPYDQFSKKSYTEFADESIELVNKVGKICNSLIKKLSHN